MIESYVFYPLQAEPTWGWIAMRLTESTQLLRLLLARLERVSVDSYWAHRASGVRGGLLRALERIEAGQVVDESGLTLLMDKGFRILEQAAQERSK
jgi:hypothetical protein